MLNLGMADEHFKTSFAPIADADTSILVLGSLPGDRSLAMAEYYGHPANRLWKVLAGITGNDVPLNYDEKKALLAKTNIGLWDVAHTATRKGSLDTAILNEVPNQLDQFIEQHTALKVVAFNGAKSEAMFNRYFKRREEITYISLPSTSPANAKMRLPDLCAVWEQILLYR